MTRAGAVTLRPARPGEAADLTALALQSKAHWGYDAAFMAACRDDLTVRADDVRAHPCTVAAGGGRVLGFCSLRARADGDQQLEHLFVAPDAMGLGVGRALWDAAVRAAREVGAAALWLDSDPYAEAFYLKMGARRVGEAPSTAIPGRVLPLLRADLRAT